MLESGLLDVYYICFFGLYIINVSTIYENINHEMIRPLLHIKATFTFQQESV
jgi:hypothetical protein